MTDATEEAPEDGLVAATEVENMGDAFSVSTHIVRGEDEDYEDFVERRKMVKYVLKLMRSLKYPPQPATRLVAGGMRYISQDVYGVNATSISRAEKTRRRAAGKVARSSRKRNR